jgi:16S rRNA (cytosine1402-N4)-methyltransferase
MSGQKENDDARGGLKAHGEYASEYHAPVLCKAVVKGLVTNRDGMYVDGTLGGGGHAAALLDSLSERGRVIGIDRDDDALVEAATRLSREVERDRFVAVKGDFRDAGNLLADRGIDLIDGLLLDLGVSSHQLDVADRGFSHRLSGPLDMRMDVAEAGDAAELLNAVDEHELTRILRRFGEEPRARRISAALVAARPIGTTKDLADAVRSAVPPHEVAKSLSRVFQAVRIVVNDELGALEHVLNASLDFVRVGGRIAVISYHSLEDRRVKRFFRSGNFEGTVHRDVFGNSLSPLAEVRPSPVSPDSNETETNPRARSARLRIAERLPGADAAPGRSPHP